MTSVAAMGFHFARQKATQTYSSFIYIIYYTILYTAGADPGEGPGGPGHPLFLDQTEAQRAEKTFIGELRTPYSPSSQGLEPALYCPR